MSVCNDLPKSNLHLYKWFCANIRVNGDTIIDPIVGDKFFISDDDRAMIFIIFDKDDAVKFRLSCTGFTSIL